MIPSTIGLTAFAICTANANVSSKKIQLSQQELLLKQEGLP